jgi:KUP system potassium uptake protein
VILLGLFGAALFYGDGLITPAISVLSAVEGLEVATPVFAPYVVPITLGILVALFWIQSHGTAKVGVAFGPITCVWFAALGGARRDAYPASSRHAGGAAGRHALAFLLPIRRWASSPWAASSSSSPAAEALYADMGHFGRRPIRLAWFGLVLPALLLNYFGQGACCWPTRRRSGTPST